jgi:type II secretory pathway pseudopilin PulG
MSIRRPQHRRTGFTLIEAMVSMTITALAGAVLLLGVQTSMQTTTDSLEEAQAMGMAQQLLDEILSRRYMATGTTPYASSLGPSNWEYGSAGRERYNDIDDYNGYTAQAAEDQWGIEMGQGDGNGGYRHPDFRVYANAFADWRQSVSVYYVDEDDPSVRLSRGRTSNLRAVEVTIHRVTTEGDLLPLAHLKRIVAYVPPPE